MITIYLRIRNLLDLVNVYWMAGYTGLMVHFHDWGWVPLGAALTVAALIDYYQRQYA